LLGQASCSCGRRRIFSVFLLTTELRPDSTSTTSIPYRGSVTLHHSQHQFRRSVLAQISRDQHPSDQTTSQSSKDSRLTQSCLVCRIDLISAETPANNHPVHESVLFQPTYNGEWETGFYDDAFFCDHPRLAVSLEMQSWKNATVLTKDTVEDMVLLTLPLWADSSAPRPPRATRNLCCESQADGTTDFDRSLPTGNGFRRLYNALLRVLDMQSNLVGVLHGYASCHSEEIWSQGCVNPSVHLS
jgi:hypothetical protein